MNTDYPSWAYLLYLVASAACGWSAFLFLFFDHIAVANGTTSVKSLSQSGFVPLLTIAVAFFTALFFALRVNQLTRVFILIMVTGHTIFIRQGFLMNIMRINY
jgi:hypothetical protein